MKRIIKKLPAIIVGIITALCILIATVVEATSSDLDYINLYEVVVDPRNDGTLDISIHLNWEVLDSTSEGPLEWVKIGIPNKYVDEIQDIFKRAKTEYTDILIKYKNMFADEAKTLTDYSKLKKLQNKYNKMLNNAMRNVGTGGLEDIYDALSGGTHQATGNVRFGHGPKYYASTENKISEIFANYCELSINRPDLIKALKRDKPELVKYLDDIVDKMLEKR